MQLEEIKEQMQIHVSVHSNQKMEMTERIKTRACDVTMGNGIHFELEGTKKAQVQIYVK